MKKFLLSVLFFITVIQHNLAQTTDTSFGEMKSNGKWVKYRLTIFTRNADCNYTTIVDKSWNANTQSWTKFGLARYKYDSSGRLVDRLVQSWDSSANAWINVSRQLFIYSNDASQVINIYQNWLQNKWANNSRIIMHYDDSGLNFYNEDYSFSEVNNTWVEYARDFFTFDNNDHVSSAKIQVWVNNRGKWINASKTNYSYTGDGETLDFNWDTAANAWVKRARTFNKYLPDSVFATKSHTENAVEEGWVNVSVVENTFNDNDQLLKSFAQEWDSTEWVNNYKTSSDYYPDGSAFHAMIEFWDPVSGTWATGFRATYTDPDCINGLQIVNNTKMKNDAGISVYSKNGTYTVHSLPQISTNKNGTVQNTFNSVALDARTFAYNITLNNSDNTKQYSFEMILSSTPKQHPGANKATANAIAVNNRFVLSPNPAKNYFTIRLAGYKNTGDVMLKISDVSGRLVMQQKINASQQNINVSSLQKGMYIISVISEKQVQTQKLIVE